MLTSSQRPGVPTFVSKQRTYVLTCASDRSYIAFNVLYVVRHPLENTFHKPPLPLGNYYHWTPPLPIGISHDLPWGGGVGIFYGTTQWNFHISTLHCCTKRQTRPLWDHDFDSSQFCRLLLWLKMLRSITFKYLQHSNSECTDAAIYSSYSSPPVDFINAFMT